MILLTNEEKQQIQVGSVLVPIGTSAIKFLHGLLTTSWVILEGINLFADHIKVNPVKKEHQISNSLIFDNYLVNSKITIES